MQYAFSVRGRSQTTFTRSGFFWPPTSLRLHFLWYKCLQKVKFFDQLPPSSCKRSLWTPPYSLLCLWWLYRSQSSYDMLKLDSQIFTGIQFVKWDIEKKVLCSLLNTFLINIRQRLYLTFKKFEKWCTYSVLLWRKVTFQTSKGYWRVQYRVLAVTD